MKIKMRAGTMAMAGSANVCLWHGLMYSGLGNSGRRVGRLQLPRCKQQRLCKLEVLADHRNVELPENANEQLMDDRLLQYVQAQVREPEILKTLREETSKMEGSSMQVITVLLATIETLLVIDRDDSVTGIKSKFYLMVTPDQAVFGNVGGLMGAEKCIEGYSALAVALELPDSGCLVACDRSEVSLAVAHRCFELAGVSHKVDVRLGMALDTLSELLVQGGAGRYDLAFLDADKRMYPEYYELLLQLVRPGGLVVVDNVLWHGTVADLSVVDKTTQSIRDFNYFLFTDNRIDYNLVSFLDILVDYFIKCSLLGGMASLVSCLLLGTMGCVVWASFRL